MLYNTCLADINVTIIFFENTHQNSSLGGGGRRADGNTYNLPTSVKSSP